MLQMPPSRRLRGTAIGAILLLLSSGAGCGSMGGLLQSDAAAYTADSDCHLLPMPRRGGQAADCVFEPPYYGYAPTCWRRWPDGWGCKVAPCQEELGEPLDQANGPLDAAKSPPKDEQPIPAPAPKAATKPEAKPATIPAPKPATPPAPKPTSLPAPAPLTIPAPVPASAPVLEPAAASAPVLTPALAPTNAAAPTPAPAIEAPVPAAAPTPVPTIKTPTPAAAPVPAVNPPTPAAAQTPVPTIKAPTPAAALGPAVNAPVPAAAPTPVPAPMAKQVPAPTAVPTPAPAPVPTIKAPAPVAAQSPIPAPTTKRAPTTNKISVVIGDPRTITPVEPQRVDQITQFSPVRSRPLPQAPEHRGESEKSPITRETSPLATAAAIAKPRLFAGPSNSAPVAQSERWASPRSGRLPTVKITPDEASAAAESLATLGASTVVVKFGGLDALAAAAVPAPAKKLLPRVKMLKTQHEVATRQEPTVRLVIVAGREPNSQGAALESTVAKDARPAISVKIGAPQSAHERRLPAPTKSPLPKVRALEIKRDSVADLNR